GTSLSERSRLQLLSLLPPVGPLAKAGTHRSNYRFQTKLCSVVSLWPSRLLLRGSFGLDLIRIDSPSASGMTLLLQVCRAASTLAAPCPSLARHAPADGSSFAPPATARDKRGRTCRSAKQSE